jgi:hypothetical protein
MKKLYTLIFCLLAAYAQAQQLDQVGKKDGIKVNGGIGMSNNFYYADGINNRLRPYYYVLTGNVNVNMYGFSLPFTFTWSNQNFAYRQPFNIVGVSPTYKKFTFHAGYRNLSFSPYTLSGHSFLGGGVEYKGDAVSVVAMGGRLFRAVDFDTTVSSIPQYARWGGGAKVTYRIGQDEVFLAGFYAKDMTNSIGEVPLNLGLRPQENQVYSIGGKKVLYEKLTLQGEIAQSAWTSDISGESATKSTNILSNLYVVDWNQNTQVYNAYKASANYDFTIFTLGAGYEHVDPEYRTLGAYYFNNDLENITLNFSTSLLKKKVTLSANGGLQRDDLKNTKASSMKRKVGSVNISANPVQRLNLNFSFSTFNSFMNIKPVEQRFLQNTPYDNMDTLNFTQVSSTMTGGVSYKIIESDHVSKNISINSSTMKASSKQTSTTTGNQMINGSLVFTQMWKKSGLNLSFNTNGNQTSYTGGNSLYLGLGINSGMPVLQKKVRVSLSANINQNYEKGDLVARLFTISNSYAFKIAKKHNLSASLRYLGRGKVGDATLGRYNTSFNEFTGILSYNYSF